VSELETQFAAWLATLEPAKQSAALSRARLSAINATPQEAFEPPIRTLGQYLLDSIEVPPVLVEPFIVVRGGITCTIGRAGKGKTVMNLNRIFKWAAGEPLFKDFTDKDGVPLLTPTNPDGLKILVIENEGAGGLFHRQVGIMLHAEGYLNDAQRDRVKENVLIWGDGGYSNLKLDDPVRIKQVKDGCDKWQPDIVFVEPFRGLWTGEENSATDMAVVVDALSDIASEHGCGIMLAHHERKSGAGEDGEKMSAGRGSTVLEGAVSVMENFESAKKGDYRELSWSKSRHGPTPHPARMEWDAEAWWYKHVPTSLLDETILTALSENSDEPMTLTDLMEATNEKRDTLRKHAEGLVKTNRLRRLPSVSDGRGSTGARYRLVQLESTGGISL